MGIFGPSMRDTQAPDEVQDDTLTTADAVTPPVAPTAAPADTTKTTPGPVKPNAAAADDAAQKAYTTYVASGIRKKFAPQFPHTDWKALSDDEVLKRHYARFGEGQMTPNDYLMKLDEHYGFGAGFEPPVPPKPTLGQRVQQGAEVAKDTALGVAPYFLPAVLKVAGVATKAIPGLTQAAFGAWHAGALLGHEQQRELAENELHQIPADDVDQRAQELYAQIQPGLARQGYPDDQIKAEAYHRAELLSRENQQRLQGEAHGQQSAEINETARAAADAFFLGVGAKPIEGLLGKSLARVGVKLGAEGSAANVAPTLLAGVGQHIKEGIIVGAPGMAIQGAIEHGLQAKADKKPISEIGKELVKGAIGLPAKGQMIPTSGALGGAVAGAVLGGTLGAVAEGIGGAARKGAAAAAFRESAAQAEFDEARLRGWQERRPHEDRTSELWPESATPPRSPQWPQSHVVDRPTQDMARVSFSDGVDARERLQAEQSRRAQIESTASTFDPHTMGITVDTNPESAATTAIQQAHGDDAAHSEVGLRAATTIADKIRLFQAAERELQKPAPPNVADLAAQSQAQQRFSASVQMLARHAGMDPNDLFELVRNENMRPIDYADAFQKYGIKASDLAALREMNPETAGGEAPQAPAAAPSETPKGEAPSEAPPVVPTSAPAPASGAMRIPEEAAPAPKPQTSPSAPPSEESVLTPATVSSNPAARALSAMNLGEHAQASVTPEGEINLERLGGPNTPKGTHAQVLSEITRRADEHGVPVVTRLTKVAANGGRIPIEKQLPWYEKHGFQFVEGARIPEGQLETATLRREPIGQHQAKVAAQLEKAAADARVRINAKLGRVNAGFDPSLLRDYAIETAAQMFARGLRSKNQVASWLVERYGEDVKPFIEKITDAAQKHFVRMFGTTGNATRQLQTLLDLGASGKHGADWYEGTATRIRQLFGKDSEMMLRFLAVTSANSSTEAGAEMAMKAYAQWRMGMPFTGFRGESMVGQLQVAAGALLGTSEPVFGQHTKIQNFYDALAGDHDAVVLDRWMMDALKMKLNSASNLSEGNYRIYSHIVRELADMNGMTPRQFQAAVWEGARIRQAHVAEATGGKSATTKLGSARPLEDLVDRKLGGMSVDEYIKAAHGKLNQMDALYNALKPVRTGEASGHTFDITDFSPSKQQGYATSLISVEVPKNELYPGALLKFQRQVQPLVKELKGTKLTLGVFASEEKPGMFSIDLNAMLPDREQALQVGKLNRQEAIANLGPGGDWIENIPTGFKSKPGVPKFLPPKSGVTPVWMKQQLTRAKAFMAAAANGAQDRTPARIEEALLATGSKVVKMSDLPTPRALRSESYWITPDGKILTVPNTHAHQGKLVRTQAGLEAVKNYEENDSAAGPNAQALINHGFLRVQLSGNAAAFDTGQNLTDAQRRTIKGMVAHRPRWAGTVSAPNGRLLHVFGHTDNQIHHFLARASGG